MTKILRSYRVFWALWMAACLLPVRIAHNEKIMGKLTEIGLFFGGKITPQGIVAALIVLAIIVAGITWKILRKQRVTA